MVAEEAVEVVVVVEAEVVELVLIPQVVVAVDFVVTWLYY